MVLQDRPRQPQLTLWYKKVDNTRLQRLGTEQTMSILLFTGNSGSGKTTLAESLTKKHRGTLIRERVICHGLAVKYGHKRTREWIAAVGALQVGAELSEETAGIIAKKYDGSLFIVDGAYDVNLPGTILDNVPHVRKLGIVAVNAERSVCVPRVAQRLGGVGMTAATNEIDFLDGVKEQFGMSAMMGRADLVLNGSLDLATSCLLVEQLLERLPERTVRHEP